MLRTLAKACMLIILGTCLGALVVRSEPQTITLNVVMIEYRFIPGHLTFGIACMIACTWRTAARKPMN